MATEWKKLYFYISVNEARQHVKIGKVYVKSVKTVKTAVSLVKLVIFIVWLSHIIKFCNFTKTIKFAKILIKFTYLIRVL